MARIDNLNHGEMASLVARVKKLEVASPLGFSSITRGSLRVASPEGLIVEGSAKVSGTLSVTGTETVTGTLNVAGPLNVTGTQTVAGPLNVTGTATVSGPLNVNGPANITGATTLTNNLTVTGSGKIVAGALQIGPIFGDGFGGLYQGVGQLYMAAPDGIKFGDNVSCLKAMTVYGSMFAQGNLVNAGIGTTTTAANVHVDAAGQFRKVTSAARFKIDPQPMSLPDSLLAVPVKDWFDKGAHDRGEHGPRVAGIVAEEVEAAGGASFVTYNDDGQIEGVSYDRLALARTEILARQVAELVAQVAKLQAAQAQGVTS